MALVKFTPKTPTFVPDEVLTRWLDPDAVVTEEAPWDRLDQALNVSLGDFIEAVAEEWTYLDGDRWHCTNSSGDGTKASLSEGENKFFVWTSSSELLDGPNSALDIFAHYVIKPLLREDEDYMHVATAMINRLCYKVASWGTYSESYTRNADGKLVFDTRAAVARVESRIAIRDSGSAVYYDNHWSTSVKGISPTRFLKIMVHRHVVDHNPTIAAKIIALVLERNDYSAPKPSDLYIGFANGDLNLDTGNVEKPNAEHGVYGVCSVDYDPEATCPKFEEILARHIEEEDIPHFWVLVGLCLSGSLQMDKMGLSIGEKRTGKSFFQRIVSEIVGESSVGRESLASLTESRWGAAELQGRTMNICDDETAKYVENSHVLKKLTSRMTGMISVERKNVPAFKTHLGATIWITCNATPRFDDPQLLSRIIWVRHKNSLYGNEPQTILRDEYEGIAAKAVKALQEVRANGYMPQEFVAAEMARDIDIVAQFVHEHGPGSYTNQTIRDYLTLNGSRFQLQQFKRRLKDEFGAHDLKTAVARGIVIPESGRSL